MANSVTGGVFNMIPLRDAITEAKMYLQIKDDSCDDDLEILAWNAVRNIATLSSFDTKVEKIKVCNNKVELPKLCAKFLWFRICGEVQKSENDGLANPTTFSAMTIYADIPFLNSCDSMMTGDYADATSYVRINDGYLEFNNPTDYSFDHVLVAYVGYKTDEYGVFRISDTTKPAVVYRICAEFALMHPNRYGKAIDLYERKATAARNYAKSIDWKTEFQNNIDQINAMFRAYNYSNVVSRRRSRY
jgi:hypothetical protein